MAGSRFKLNMPHLPPGPGVLLLAWALIMLGFAQGVFDVLPEPPAALDPDSMILEGYQRIDDGEPAGALTSLRRAAEAVGDTGVILIGLGRCYLGLDDLDRAEDYLVRGILERQHEIERALQELGSLRDELVDRAQQGEDTARAIAAANAIEVTLADAPNTDPVMALGYESLGRCCETRAEVADDGNASGGGIDLGETDLIRFVFDARATNRPQRAHDLLGDPTASLQDAATTTGADASSSLPREFGDAGSATDVGDSGDASEAASPTGGTSAIAYRDYAARCYKLAEHWRAGTAALATAAATD